MGDITFRAVEILNTVDLIASEDTRRTGLLLKHYGIPAKQTAYHDHNKERVTPILIDRLKNGSNIAVVSDAGTPGISDPGFYLIRECLKHEITVLPLPGASSLLASLVISGLPTDRFVFEGFLPRARGKMKARLNELCSESRTMIFFESPHRLVKTLTAMLEHFGDRKAFTGREITKKFEQHHYGKISTILEEFVERLPKGEFVIVIQGR
jgi:16S rRNA (cytidine1402-2'-O)-methyltransferase